MAKTDQLVNQSRVTAAGGRAGPVDRTALADEFNALMPRMRRRLEALWPADVREELASVTPHQCEALVAIVDSGGLTMNDLARHQNVSLSGCTALADRLIRQGLAERVSDPSDRRVVRLRPTARASLFVERFRAAKRASAMGVRSSLDDAELGQLLALIRKMAGDPVPARCR